MPMRTEEEIREYEARMLKRYDEDKDWGLPSLLAGTVADVLQWVLGEGEEVEID